MDFRRRRLLTSISLLAGAGWPPVFATAQGHRHSAAPAQVPSARRPPSPRDTTFSTPLRLPGREGLFADVRATAGLHLEAGIARERIFPGPTTDLMAYRGRVDGRAVVNPLLRLRTGDTLDATLDNRLGEDTTIHWHGMLVDEKNDGSGMHPVRAGASYAYRFKVLNRSGLFWYHPHPHDRTGAQVQLGMGSLLLVEDAEDDALRRELGLDFGDTELPLVIQDKEVDTRNRIRYSMGEDDWIGNRVLVNWTPEPRLEVRTCLYRFRILNASNARPYLLAFVAGRRTLPFTIIGTDAGLLERSRAVDRAFLAPAQRLDVLVDFGKEVAGTTVMLSSLAFDPMENDGRPVPDPAIEHPGAPLIGAPFDIMRIDVRVPVCAPRTIPASLSSMPPMPRAKGAPRRFRLHVEGMKLLINGYNYHQDMRAVKAWLKRGTTETWEIRNDVKSMPHPMHLHGFHFRVVERRASPAQVRRLAITPAGLTAADLGWLDTVMVWPGETVRIAIDFAQPFKGRQTYMFHCHNLEHEDQGLMMNVAVTD